MYTYLCLQSYQASGLAEHRTEETQVRRFFLPTALLLWLLLIHGCLLRSRVPLRRIALNRLCRHVVAAVFWFGASTTHVLVDELLLFGLNCKTRVSGRVWTVGVYKVGTGWNKDKSGETTTLKGVT